MRLSALKVLTKDQRIMSEIAKNYNVIFEQIE